MTVLNLLVCAKITHVTPLTLILLLFHGGRNEEWLIDRDFRIRLSLGKCLGCMLVASSPWRGSRELQSLSS